MKKYFYILIFFLLLFVGASDRVYASHIADGSTQFLSSPLNVAIYCGDVVRNSMTFSDEPYRLLKSLAIGGQFAHDDIGEINYTVNGDGHTFFKNQPCKCGEGCSGSDILSWLTIFQDSLQPSPDSVTVTGAAIETFKRYTDKIDPARQSLVHFEGLGISPIWRLCDQKQVTNNGACYTIGGDIGSDKTTCVAPCSPNISWSSNYATNVSVRRTDGKEIGSGSQNNNGIIDPGLSAGTYTYVLYGTGSSGNNASQEFELDRVTVTVKPGVDSSPTEKPTCNSTNATLDSPVTLEAQGGPGPYSWSTLGGAPSSGTGQSFTTSYSTTGTKTVNVSNSNGSGTCEVNVSFVSGPDIDPSRVDIKANGSDIILSLSDTAGLFTLSWGATGGGTPNYSLCRSTGDWPNTNQPTSGSVLINVIHGVSFTKTYGISCTTPFATNTSDSVTVSVIAPDKQPSQQGCSLSVSSPSIRVGESATWIVQSQPSGYSFNWQGSDNGVTIKSRAGTGPTNRGEIYTYNSVAEYERYAEVQFSDKICTTNKVRLSVTKEGGGGSSGGGGLPPGGGTLSCSIAENSPYPNGKFTATASGGPSGQDYNWAWPQGACAGVINGNQLSMNCGATQCGNCSVRVNSFANPNSVATCSFSNCPSGGCEIVLPPEEPVTLQVATDGKEDFSGNWQKSFRGTVPILGVDLFATPSIQNIASFVSEYRFDCTNDGSFEAIRKVNPQQGGSASAVAVNACDYRNPGIYTAKVVAFGGRQFLPQGELGSGTAVITVDPLPEQFNIDEVTWSIQSGTPRYRADYDYDNNAVLNKSDRDILLAVVSSSKQCPQNKNCDINGNGNVNIGDAFTYSKYLKIYKVYYNTAEGSNAKAQIYLSSVSGATVNLSTDAPKPNLIESALGGPPAIPAGGKKVYNLNFGAVPLGNYTFTVTGVAGGGTTQTSGPMTFTIEKQPSITCPSGVVTLSSSSIRIGQSVTASAPSSFSGGSFVSSNPNVASVSGSTVTGRSAGTANISGFGWNNTNGATGCQLSATGGCTGSSCLVVSLVPSPDFGLIKSRDIFVNIVGTQPAISNSAKITVGVFDGFASNVNLSVESVKSPRSVNFRSPQESLPGATFNFSDSSLSPSEFLTGSDFSVTVPANTSPGDYTIKIEGKDGGLTRGITVPSIDIKLNVITRDPSFREI